VHGIDDQKIDHPDPLEDLAGEVAAVLLDQEAGSTSVRDPGERFRGTASPRSVHDMGKIQDAGSTRPGGGSRYTGIAAPRKRESEHLESSGGIAPGDLCSNSLIDLGRQDL
jgi:hypothetical protein